MKKILVILSLAYLFTPNIKAQTLNPGDGVRITFLNITDQITGDYFIQQDGNIQLPFIGLVKTASIDYKEIKKNIFTKYSELYKDPALTIQPLLKINILGEVRTPGYYYVTDIEKMSGILALAGGVTGAAATDDIYIIRDGQEIELSKSDVIERGNTAADIGLKSGDRIFISRSFWADAGQYGLILSGIAVLATLLSIVLR
ncbi:MAG: polysaccharide biosynthesis/export family protein [Ignavibacteriales bacterium]|nr:polysaccharide biosynthesis/export family protein [Ignavibacteriales bacterium]